MKSPTLIVHGTSITDSTHWPTWATWIHRGYAFDNLIDLSQKGIGNEILLSQSIKKAYTVENPFLVVQLTCFDKWDWYVENNHLVTELDKEKHKVIRVSQDSEHGYWSTGSHFPLYKSEYREKYFSLKHSVFSAFQQIQWFKLLCAQNSWQYQILLESPVFAVTEEDLNQAKLDVEDLHSTRLLDGNELCSGLDTSYVLDDLYLPGIIGYAKLNNLQWYHPRFKCHPGSLVHLMFVKNILAEKLDKQLTRKSDFNDFYREADKYQSMLEKLQ